MASPADRPGVGREQELDPDTLGRVQPAQRGELAVGSSFRPQPSSRSVNSNKVAAMTGISANASGAAGRCGAWVALNAAEAATSPQTASRGARPDSAPSCPPHQEHRAHPGGTVQAEEQATLYKKMHSIR